MRIDKAGKHNLTFAIDLDYSFAIFLQPGIAQGILGFANRDNLAGVANHGGVFDDAKFLELRASARGGDIRAGTQSKKLTNIYQ